jgi:hypothetical protein
MLSFHKQINSISQKNQNLNQDKQNSCWYQVSSFLNFESTRYIHTYISKDKPITNIKKPYNIHIKKKNKKMGHFIHKRDPSSKILKPYYHIHSF